MNDLASETMTATSKSLGLDFNTPALQRKRRLRALKDRIARWAISFGGMAVLGAITLIFFYLAYVVLPMFQGASLDSREPVQVAWLNEAAAPLLLTLEEQNQVAMRLDQSGQVQFFDAKKMQPLSSVQLPIPADTRITSFGQDQPGSNRVALGLSNGQVLVFQHVYKLSYPNDVQTVTPKIEFPFGDAPIELDVQGRELDHLGLSLNGGTLMLAGSTGAQLHVLSLGREENMMTGEVALTEERIVLPQIAEPIKELIIDPRHMWMYVINGRATADVFDMRSNTLNGRYKLLADAKLEVSNATPLLGGISLLIGDSAGGIGQWFMVREDDGKASLTSIRNFQLADSPIIQIIPEERRKGFFALDAKGNLGIFHSTAHRTLLVEPVAEGQALIALSPRANRVLVESEGQLQRLIIDNPHPEISWSSLWGKVWYENYDAPGYVWQSTSASTDNEPKLSLAPLAFGTLKAAFYAMLLATPLAIAAALYTAYFMARCCVARSNR